MAFVDISLLGGPIGKTVVGLELSLTAAMTLEVATGTVTLHHTGGVYTLASAQSHALVADATFDTVCWVAIIDNGSSTDIWVDAYVDDGDTGRADVPGGYVEVHGLAWFTIPPGETDLANVTINRRILV